MVSTIRWMVSSFAVGETSEPARGPMFWLFRTRSEIGVGVPHHSGLSVCRHPADPDDTRVSRPNSAPHSLCHHEIVYSYSHEDL